MLSTISYYQTVKDLMNSDIPFLNEQSTIREAIELFRKEKVMIMPLLDKHNSFIGVVTPSSLFKVLLDGAMMDEHILPYRIQNVVTVKESEDPFEVQQFLLKNKVGQAVVLTDDHQVCGVLDTMNIIQAYKSKSESLANSLNSLIQHMQMVLDTTYDGHIIINHDETIEMINDAACEFVQIPREALIGQPVSQVIPEIRLEEALATSFQIEKLEAMKIGKRRCLVKKIPIIKNERQVGAIAKIFYKDLNKWKTVINRLDHLEKEVSFYRSELSLKSESQFEINDILTQNKVMERRKELARQAASGFSNILLLGESGTGKELFARGIHSASNRLGNFITVNCAAIPDELWESEFFGYADGAFTGAKRGGKQGKFELANNGTIFLDEIGDMPLPMQVKLLRVLQEREFERVGGTETIRVNVRIIAATNRDLKKLVAINAFREDLFYRLNVISIEIPPLRERVEDIPLLAVSIAKKFSQLMSLDEMVISDSAMSLLTSHHWPGNVRELENTIERAMNCINDNQLDVEHLPEYLQIGSPTYHHATVERKQDPFASRPNSQAALSHDLYKTSINKVEKDTIHIALKEAGGNRTEAAKILGISRSQLYNKMKKLGI